MSSSVIGIENQTVNKIDRCLQSGAFQFNEGLHGYKSVTMQSNKLYDMKRYREF